MQNRDVEPNYAVPIIYFTHEFSQMAYYSTPSM